MMDDIELDLDYMEDLRIEVDALDVEWVRQPQVYMNYAEALAYARMKLDKAKENLDVVRAEVTDKIRKRPKKYGLEKVTEAGLALILLKQPEYRKANKRLIKYRFKVELLAGACRAFEQRKKALENLVFLHGQKYFAGPKEPRDLRKQLHNREASTERRIEDRLNRKKKKKKKKNKEE